MKRFVVLDKPIGQTPLQAILEWKSRHPRYKPLPATYAGRLDPMASGNLLVLLGEECKKKEHYMGLDKQYTVSVLLDLATDTGDALGMPHYAGVHTLATGDEIRDVVKAEVGTRTHAYPAYSSKTVNGIPLFLHALSGTLSGITVPTHSETMYSISLKRIESVDILTLSAYIDLALRVVPRDDLESKEAGMDFRQDAIRDAWRELFTSMPDRSFTILTLTVVAGTGAYMRTLAERLGQALGTSALAVSIHRTRIGRYRAIGPLRFFFPSY